MLVFVCQRCRVLRWDLAPAPTSKTQHRTLTPPNAASGRQAASHFLHAAGALSRQKGRASGQSRDVCAPACRWAAHATERGPVAPPVAFSALPTPPIAASGRQPPLTRGRRPLAAKGSSERAESRCLRTRVLMGGTRSGERPCRAASSVPHSPRHQMPPQGASHLLHAAGALSRQKGRASGQSRAMSAHPRADGRHTQPREALSRRQ